MDKIALTEFANENETVESVRRAPATVARIQVLLGWSRMDRSDAEVEAMLDPTRSAGWHERLLGRLAPTAVMARRKKMLLRWLRGGAGARAFPGLILPQPRTHYSMFHRCEVSPSDVWCQWEEEIGAYFPDSLADDVPAPRGQVLHRGLDRQYRIGAALLAAMGIE